MPSSSLLHLLLLASIWGSSFLFMRIAAPVLAAAWIAEVRVALAAVFLAVVGHLLGRRLEPIRYWRHYLTLGFFGAGLPFLLFAYAAQALSASLLAILNATAPLWGAAIAALIGREKLTARVALGLLIGIAGVALLVGFDPAVAGAGALPALTAGLAASFSYGIASNYAATAPSVGAFQNAQGSMSASALVLLPVALLSPVDVPPAAGIIGAVAALGVMCSGIAYILYFRLIHDLGATSALSVTFLVPVFGMLWGALFLGETIGPHMLAGALVVLVGTSLVTGYSLSDLRAVLRGASTD